MKPVVHGLEAEYWGRVDFVYLDREDPANADIVRLFGVTYQPVFVFVAPDGTLIQRWTVPSPDDLRAELDSYLAAQSG